MRSIDFPRENDSKRRRLAVLVIVLALGACIKKDDNENPASANAIQPTTVKREPARPFATYDLEGKQRARRPTMGALEAAPAPPPKPPKEKKPHPKPVHPKKK